MFLGKVKEEAGDIGEVGNKLSIEIGKAHEGMNILGLLWVGQEQTLSSLTWSMASSSG